MSWSHSVASKVMDDGEQVGATTALEQLNTHGAMMLRLMDMQECLDSGSKDMKKLFRRMQQLEARQVELVHTTEDKLTQRLDEHIHRLDEAVACTSSRTTTLEGQVLEQQQKLDEATTSMKRNQNDLGNSLQVFINDSISNLNTCHAQQQQQAQASFKVLEKDIKVIEKKLENLLSDRKSALHIKLQQGQDNLTKRVEELCAKVKAQPRVQSEPTMQIVQQNMCIHPAELEKISIDATEKYDNLASQLQALCQRIVALEITSTNFVGNLTRLETRFVDSCNSMDMKLQVTLEGFNGESTHLNKLAAELSCKLDDFEKRQDQRDDHVRKALSAAKTIEDKVKAFDLMERRMGELVQNTEILLASQKAGTTKCLICGPSGAAGDLGGSESNGGSRGNGHHTQMGALHSAAKDGLPSGRGRDRAKSNSDNGDVGTASWRESVLESIRKHTGSTSSIPTSKSSDGHNSGQAAKGGEAIRGSKAPPAGAALAACRAVSSEARCGHTKAMLPSKRPKSARSRDE